MRILKIRGKDEQTILSQIKKDYGHEAVIISTQFEKEKGFFSFLKKPNCCITIAVSEEEPTSNETQYMFSYLKNQIEDIKDGLAKATLPKEDTVFTEIKADSNLKDLLEQKLVQEGIALEVVEELARGVENESSIEETARRIYANISLKMPVTTEEQVLPQVVCFVGSTGVGKTTTIAKLTAEYVLNQHKKVVLFTADTYRIAAIEQLKTYAEILGVPIEVIYTANDLENQLVKYQDYDYILIDTAGRSHKNIEQMQDMQELLKTIEEKQVYLVLNINTNYKDVKRIVDVYRPFIENFQLIITKLDETDEIGNLLNISAYAKAPIAYITNGQNVPEDIKTFDCDDYVKTLIGRISYE